MGFTTPGKHQDRIIAAVAEANRQHDASGGSDSGGCGNWLGIVDTFRTLGVRRVFAGDRWNSGER